MKLEDVWERVKNANLVDVLMTIGFSIIGLCGGAAWAMFMFQLWLKNPLVGGFASVFSVGLAFVIAGLVLMDTKGY